MTDTPLAIGSMLAGKYKLLRVLGTGGMGAVYLAENVDIGRQVAIKVLHAHISKDPGAAQRFRQEARASAVIRHPGVVDVLDMGETASGQAFIVMEKLEGETLAARMKQRGKLSVDETIAIVSEALDAIAAAHGKGIVHRDLKPENLFLVWHPKWGVKILDFGISRVTTAEELRITASATVMGSVLYMPPEQARDARSAGPPADLYSLGAVLYHALAGRPPFLGENYSEVLSRVLTDRPIPLATLCPDVPAELAMLVMSLLEKRPADRPASAELVRDQLRALAPRIVPAEPPPPSPDALGDTLAPGAAAATGAALAETAAAAGATGLAATAAATALSMAPQPAPPRGAFQTSAVAGEVAMRPARVTRRWLVLGISVVVMLTTAGTWFSLKDRSTHATNAADALLARDAALPDAAPDAVVHADAAIDAPPIDGGRRAPRPDARPAREPKLDAAAHPAATDAGFLGIQPIPDEH